MGWTHRGVHRWWPDHHEWLDHHEGPTLHEGPDRLVGPNHHVGLDHHAGPGCHEWRGEKPDYHAWLAVVPVVVVVVPCSPVEAWRRR